jgi:hypothetical protein
VLHAPEDLPALLARLREEAHRRAPRDLAGLAHPRIEQAPSAALVTWLHARRVALAEWLDETVPPPRPGHTFAQDPAGHLAAELVRYLLSHNQFLPLDGRRVAALEALHARALSSLAQALRTGETESTLSGALARVATAYREELAAFVAGLGPDAGEVLLAPLREVVSAEYGPELQLKVLGLDAATLLEPVLDLGCGPKARLVHFLREAGKPARGVDRLIEPGPGLLRADWLDVPLPPKSLGTLLSHLAFSLHFLHHHLRPGDGALRYARRYMELLHTLRPGGVFAYAPGLPFVEEHLDATAWGVERQPLPLPEGRPPLEIPWYASRVQRLGR